MKRKAETEEEQTARWVAHGLDRLGEEAEQLAGYLVGARKLGFGLPPLQVAAADVGSISDLSLLVQELFHRLEGLMAELNALAGTWEVELEPGRGVLLAALEGRLTPKAVKERIERWEDHEAQAELARCKASGEWQAIFELDWAALRRLPPVPGLGYSVPVAPMSQFIRGRLYTRAGHRTKAFDEWWRVAQWIGEQHGLTLEANRYDGKDWHWREGEIWLAVHGNRKAE
jgi:hypothetical protein